jgi:Co/Zn/Cd efflux system component
MTVLLEDLAAVLGCVFAAIALGICHYTQDGLWDAIAQLVIGSMLTVVGLYLVWRNRGMLIGQAINDSELLRLRLFLEDLNGIDRVTNLKTRQLSASTYVLKAEVVFSGGELAGRVFSKRGATCHEGAPALEQLGRFADLLMREQAILVDHYEDEIRENFPGALHIALEPHLRDF